MARNGSTRGLEMAEKPPHDKEATIWEHLEELMIRLRRIIIVFILATAIMSALPAGLGGEKIYTPLITVFPKIIFRHVIPPNITAFNGKTYPVIVMPGSEFESIEILTYSAVLLGIIGSAPFAAKELWEYIEPALYPHEKQFMKRYIALFTAAFLFGVFFAIYIVAPLIYLMMYKLYPLFAPEGYGIIIRVTISSVVAFTLKLAFAFGLLFEIPIAIYLALAYGVLDPNLFSSTTMKYIFLGTMITGAIISPDPSGLGMLLIGLSLYAPLHIAVHLGKKRALERRALEQAKALLEEGR
ncbi:Sec-independent protein translocase TatC [Pyrofollis japonicus]|nr:Sec-independent protein translocase TatC [Pyrofollis japonicus]